MSTYDFVIIGAGSAGCVLAERLSGDPGRTVLLVEAGGHAIHPAFQVPKGFAVTTNHPRYSWDYRTEPYGPFGRSDVWSRGKVLGGSSNINGMVYNRGAQPDYDHIEELGNPGWGWKDIKRVFTEIEDHELGASDSRGSGGPLHVSVRHDTEPVSEALMDSAAKLGLRRVRDINDSDEERVGYTAATIQKGRRVSASRAFLQPARKRPNLTIRTRTVAKRLLFDGDRAIGVLAEHGSSEVEFRARREVIVSCGSIATPQLLQVSGIGPTAVLREAGVDVRVASEKVGEGVREHRCFPLQMRLATDIGYNRKLGTLPRQGLSAARWGLTRRGPLSTPAYDMLSFMRTRDDLARPDAQVLLTPFSQGSAALKVGVEHRPGLTLLGFVLRPTSLGSVRITSPDTRVHPRIDAGYLTSDHDREKSIAMFRRMRRIVEQSPIADMLVAETVPGQSVQDEESILNSGFVNGGTGYHACGAVAMGPDATDPIDSRLRVRGVDGLRVVDVSIMPEMVSGNLNGPIMAMAWRAAEMILEDAASD